MRIVGMINTVLDTTDEMAMPQFFRDEFPEVDTDLQAQSAERCDAQRDRLRMAIGQIAAEVTTALRDESLTTDVFFAVPSGGPALLSFATADDPTDQTWERVSKIVCQIVGNTIGVTGLVGRPLTCSATGVAMVSSDVSKGVGQPLI
jgi:CBS-domain-containing membrane protein